MSYRVQKNITITKEQREFAKANHGKMSIGQLSKRLGITYNVLYKNLGLMGMVKQRKCAVVKLNGYFDADKFFNLYAY